MTTYVPDSSELLMLGYIFDRDTKIHLYKSDTTISSATTAGSFTVADFTGYSSLSIADSDWASPSTVSGKAVIQTSAAKTFSCTGGSSQVIYGFFITSDDDSNALLYAERFATSRTMTSGTDLSVTPKISLSNDDS